MIPEGRTCVRVGVSAAVLTFVFVMSLYVTSSSTNRDLPTEITNRFVRASCVMVVATLQSYYFMNFIEDGNIFNHLGIRSDSLLLAVILPLTLTFMLYLGPITLSLSESPKIDKEPLHRRVLARLNDPVWVRDYIMSPLCEEWIFRACMTTILNSCELLTSTSMILCVPLLSGAAHLHHLYEYRMRGVSWCTALQCSLFQFAYSSILGVYTTFVFIRTGHFISCLLVHIFCNFMGLPDFGAISKFPRRQRVTLVIKFIVGVALWSYFLLPFTQPILYADRRPLLDIGLPQGSPT